MPATVSGRVLGDNAKAVVIAQYVDVLHSDKNNLNKTTALTERGEVVNGRAYTPNRHDILTGADAKENDHSWQLHQQHLRQLGALVR